MLRKNANAPGAMVGGTANAFENPERVAPILPGGGTDVVAGLQGYAVVVMVPADPEPRTRRRLYLSLHSAQKAVERAQERGMEAHLVLLRFAPVGGAK